MQAPNKLILVLHPTSTSPRFLTIANVDYYECAIANSFSVDTWLRGLLFVYSRMADQLPKTSSASSRQELRMEDERNILSFNGEFLVVESDYLVADGGLLVTESDSRAGQRNNKKEGDCVADETH